MVEISQAEARIYLNTIVFLLGLIVGFQATILWTPDVFYRTDVIIPVTIGFATLVCFLVARRISVS